MSESQDKTLFDLTEKPACINPHWLEMRMGTNDLRAFAFFGRETENGKPYRMDEGIAIFDVSGPLWNGEGWFIVNNYYTNLKKFFMAAQADAEVKGILFNLDSPGGEAGGMFDLSDAIYEARGTKPVWAIANEEAFSAAYGIASATDRIYVTRTGGVGSVGVIAVHMEASEYNKKQGIAYTLVRGGKYKAEQNWIEPLSKHAHQSIQSEVDRIYGMFVGLVARNRNLAAEKIRATEAALYFGENAIEANLADRVGNLEQAVGDLKRLISSPGGNSSMSNQANQAAGNNQAPTMQGNNQTTPPAQNETAPQASTSPPAQQPAPQAFAQPAPQATDLDAIRKQAEEKVRADIQAITDLCALAHRPEMAAKLIEERLTPDQARTKLLNAMADESDATAIDSRLNPDRSANNAQTQAPRINTAEVYRNFNARPKR